MFTATGVSAKKTADGMTVVAHITRDDRQGDHAFVMRSEYTGRTFEDVQALIQADLDAMHEAATSATLNEVIVGRVLARSGGGGR